MKERGRWLGWRLALATVIAAGAIANFGNVAHAVEYMEANGKTFLGTTEIESGTIGESIIWKVDEDGVLTISGTGEIPNSYAYSLPWTSYPLNNSIVRCVIESGVTGFGDYAFNNCEKMQSIDIPDTVTNFNADAFSACYQLHDINVSILNKTYCSVDGIMFSYDRSKLVYFPRGRYYQVYNSNSRKYTIPKGVKIIGENAFAWSNNVILTMTDGVERIEKNAFLGSYVSISEIPKSVVFIDASAFDYWHGVEINVAEDNPNFASDSKILYNKAKTVLLRCAPGRSGDIVIPDGIKEIASRAFSSCRHIESVHLPESLVRIGDYAFTGCNGISEFKLPDDLKEIGDGAFFMCEGITEMVFPKEINKMGTAVLMNCVNLKEVMFPTNMVSIGEYFFGGCEALSQIVLPEGITEIGYSAFRSCTALMKVTLPESLEVIGREAFNGTPMKEITIPKGVKQIQMDAFGYLPNGYESINDCVLTDIYYRGSQSDWENIENDCKTTLVNVTIHFAEKNSDEEPIKSFVTRMYEECLSREPDEGGLNGWVGQLENGNMDGAAIAQNFVFSQELLNKNLSNEDFVETLYVSMMGRASDENGKKGWVEQLSNGNMTRSEVTKSFVESTEFTNICTSYGIERGTYDATTAPIEQFVERLYKLCLERNADQAGLYGWVGNLKNGNMNGAQMANSFFFSDEFVNKNVSNEKYVELLYNTLMGRPADADGKAGWVSQLQGGHMDRKAVMKAFIESTEFTGICNSYGIERGTIE